MIQPTSLLEKLQNEFERHSYGDAPVELYEPITYIMSLGKRIAAVG